MRTLSSLRLMSAACVAALVCASDVIHAAELTRQFNMPVTMNVSLQATGCSNAPGPQIALQGELALAGLGMDMIFTNNVKGTHTASATTTLEEEVIPAGETVAIPKQPVLGGTGGNPFIWLQLFDENGRALTSELFLGRCVQGTLQTTGAFAIPATAGAQMNTAECDNSPGPEITLDGEVALSGLNAQLIFRNSDNPVGGPHVAQDAARMNLVLLPAGSAISFPKQPVSGGVGGNPWIWALFRQADGDPIGSESLMGRCVQLSQ